MHIGQNRINKALYNFLHDKYCKKRHDELNLVDFKFNSEFSHFEKINNLNDSENTNEENSQQYKVYQYFINKFF